MTIRPRSGLFLLVMAMAVLHACQGEPAPQPGVDAVVKVRGNPVVREIVPGLIFGANFGAWVPSEKLGTPTRDLVKALRPSVGRFPGGNISNNYCWELQKVSGNDHLVWEDWSWGTDVAEYLAFLKTVGAAPMFSLMPFDHTIDGEPHSAAFEAESLARLFVAEGFPGAYYEVGNENDGPWNPMLSIDEYAERFGLLIRTVKTVDPLSQALGPVVSGFDMTWINGFLDRLTTLGATGLLDGISYHHYGGWISNSNQNGIDLNDPQSLADELATIRGALDSRGLARVKIAVTEMNAAIWDTGCTRGQFTIQQGLWLADALGVSLVGADAANVWIHLQPGTDPHALIDSEASTPQPTRNYWPVALTAQTLSSTDPAVPVGVLRIDLDLEPARLTAYAVLKPGAGLGVLLVNKSDPSLTVAVDLPVLPRSVTGRLIGPAEYDAASGPASVAVWMNGGRATVTVPGTAIVGLEIR